MHATRRALGALTAATLAVPAVAQPRYPDRPIRMIVPFGAGTTTDILGRLLGAAMATDLGGNVVVENRPGAGGVTGSDVVAKASPDGYSLVLGSIASHAINVSLMPRIPYDVLRDFTPISLVTNSPNLLVVGATVPARTLPEFIAWAKGRGPTPYASAGNGTSSHLSGELLRLRTGAPLEHVPYRNAAQAVTDVVSGQVPMMVYQVTGVLGFVREGRLRALAATSARRQEWTPDVPTAMEQGVPDYDVSAWQGLFAPAGTPTAIRDRLFASVERALADPVLRPRLVEQGLEPVGMPPDAFRTFLAADIEKWRTVVRDADIKPD